MAVPVTESTLFFRKTDGTEQNAIVFNVCLAFFPKTDPIVDISNDSRCFSTILCLFLSISELIVNFHNDEKSTLLHNKYDQHVQHAMMFVTMNMKTHSHSATQSITEFNISYSSSFQATRTCIDRI